MEPFNFNRLKRPHLIELAGHVDVKGRHRMRKRDLVRILREFLPVLKEHIDRLRPSKVVQRAGSSSTRPAPVSAPEPVPQIVDRGAPLPLHYGQDRLTLLVRDPFWVFCYWELEGPAREELKRRLGQDAFDGARWVLRLHTSLASHPQDVDVQVGASNWYLNVADNTEYFGELGIITRKGDFVGLVNSNRVRTPRSGMSQEHGQDWMIVEGDFQRVVRLRADQVQAPGREASETLARRFQVGGLSSLFLGGSRKVQSGRK